MNAVILAGSEGYDAFAESGGVKNKSFILINQKPMIKYIIEVLDKVEMIKEIVVVGPDEELEKIRGLKFKIVSEKGDIIDNLLEGLRYLPCDCPVVILTSDIPMITREALEDFVEKSRSMEADFCYSIIPKEKCENKYPGVNRTYLQLLEGSFTGGNVFTVNPAVVKVRAEKAREFIILKKKPLRLVLKLGLIFVIKFLLKKLTIKEAEKRVSEMFGIKARAVISEYPEIGTDVDKQSDLELAEKMLR